MTTPIGDYALISNLRCAALVSKGGSIDWFCPGGFDHPACFAALLGTDEHGHWRIHPQNTVLRTERYYQRDTLVLETRFQTEEGEVRVIDAMPLTDSGSHIIRRVEGISGEVPMAMRCAPRFDYGRETPSVEHRHEPSEITFHAGGNRLRLITDTALTEKAVTGEHSAADGLTPSRQAASTGEAVMHFSLSPGQERWFILCDGDAKGAFPPAPDVHEALTHCTDWWRRWVSHHTYEGPWEEEVKRSLITLKAMTSWPAGGMVAAVTTSLPEVPGGEANYDYRFCWIRDAAFALRALLNAGYREEACSWRDWLLKAVSQHERHIHALYSVEGTVAREERELDWLPGYLNSRPVRDGNAASHQYQLDIRGELMEVFHLARDHGLDWSDDIWHLQRKILERLEHQWPYPDEGIWEFRTLYENLTHSKVMSWAAFDCCIKDAEKFDLEGPISHWRTIREQIRADVLNRGVHPEGGYFTQRYGSDNVDASLLMIPLVGFLPADDPRMQATVAAIERELCSDGLVSRYRVGDQANREGKFLPCCFWLVDNYWLAGRHDEARTLFKRLLSLSNDLGLFSEEWDHHNQQLLGNFPQGLSHLALIKTAQLLSTGRESHASLT